MKVEFVRIEMLLGLPDQEFETVVIDTTEERDRSKDAWLFVELSGIEWDEKPLKPGDKLPWSQYHGYRVIEVIQPGLIKDLKAPEIEKPDPVCAVWLGFRTDLAVVYLSGKGDPSKHFDPVANKLKAWLSKQKDIQVIGSLFGIYYQDRDVVGIENVCWDACIRVNQCPKQLQKHFGSMNRKGIGFALLPKTRTISALLNGPYDLIGDALKYLKAVAKANDIEPKWPLREVYHSEDPEGQITLLEFVVDGLL